MFCPNCGQEKVGAETNFCSKCGFLLSGAAILLQTGGSLPSVQAKGKLSSKRRRGIKQGLFIFLLGFLVVPMVALISMTLKMGPELTAISALLLGVGGLLRMAYAWLLEEDAGAEFIAQSDAPSGYGALPPQRSTPASVYADPAPGSWRDTNELQPSVTEHTTRHLEQDKVPQ